jgi:urease accessory protein
MNPAAAMQQDQSQGWQARIELEFHGAGPRTILARNEHQGPLVVQKPFYPEGDGLCHVYLVHPPGGVCGGDNLAVSFDLGECAHTLATTPAAGKFYRSAGQTARLAQHFRVGNGASLEWLPQETIVYDGAVAEMTTRVELTPTANYLGWEIACLGLAASGKPFIQGTFSQRLEILRDNRPLLIENIRCQGGDQGLTAPWGLSGHTVAATFACTAAPDTAGAALAAARRAIAPFTEGSLASVSACDDLIVCRFLGHDSALAKKTFLAAWQALRPLTLGRPAYPPRIWAT